MINNTLVSVCIIAYNSSDYIIEALESVAAQTYNNIELIVSDDASSYNTVELCRNWLAAHESRFIRTGLVVVEKNTGVTANANRALKQSQGEWIKYFAGDDKLLPNCIEDNMSYVTTHPETELLFSDMLSFGLNHSGTEINSRSAYFKYLTPLQFKVHLLVQNFLPAPSAFLSRALYDRLNGFDEQIPMMEDKPLYIKALFSNCKMCYMTTPTVCYRIGEQSISQNHSPQRTMNKFEESREKAKYLVLEKLKGISPLLFIHQRNEYEYQFHPTFHNKIIHCLRFVNPAFYYIQYIFLKMRIVSHFKKHH